MRQCYERGMRDGAPSWILDTRTRCRDGIGFGVAAPVVLSEASHVVESVGSSVRPRVCPSAQVGPSSAWPSGCVSAPLHAGCACVCMRVLPGKVG